MSVVHLREQPAAQASVQIVLSLAYLLLVARWRPFVPQPIKFRRWSWCRCRIDIFNFLEMLATVLHVALQAMALVFALTARNVGSCSGDAASKCENDDECPEQETCEDYDVAVTASAKVVSIAVGVVAAVFGLFLARSCVDTLLW